jgi:hypothetical protein
MQPMEKNGLYQIIATMRNVKHTNLDAFHTGQEEVSLRFGAGKQEPEMTTPGQARRGGLLNAIEQ